MTDTTAPRTAAPDLTQNLLDSWPDGATYAFTKEAMETVVKAVRLHEREAIEPLLALVRAADKALAAQFGIHLGTVGSPEPRPEDFMPMIGQSGIDELAAALDALPESVRVAARKP